MHLGAQGQLAAPRFVGRANFVVSNQPAARRKIRRGQNIHNLIQRRFRLVHDQNRRVDSLLEVVRRNIRRQTDRNAGCAVHQQVRISRGQHIRLLERIVKVEAERHGVLVDIPQHFQRERRHARFGVTHRGRAVAVNRAEISMAVNQQGAHAVWLRHAHQRVVNRAVAMRMVFAQTIADNARAFFVRLIRRNAQLAEREENTPLNRLEAVLHARERAFQNDVLRIWDHRDMHDLFHRTLDDLVMRRSPLRRLTAFLFACHYFAFPSRVRNVSTLLKSA